MTFPMSSMHKPFKSAYGLQAALLVLVAVALSAGAVRGRPDMFHYKTAHYSIETDISLRFARLVGNHMEEIYREYSRRFQSYGHMTQQFDVAVFRFEKDYLEAVPSRVKGSTGVFVPSKSLLAAHAEDRAAEEVLRTLYHEGFHQFMFHVVSQRCPIWLNEGLAEYFSEATWNGEGFTTGQVPSARLYVVKQAIRDGSHIRFSELLTMERRQWLQNVQTDSHRASLHYSESWSIVHFLIHADGGRYVPMLEQFLREISEGKDQAKAFRSSFGTDLDAFERSWARYVMSLTPSPKFKCRENMEALMVLARLLYRDPRRFESVSTLRRDASSRGRYRWQMTRGTGERITSDDTQKVAQLFRCPYGQEDQELSYLLVRDLRNQMPVLVCNHHPGIIIKAYYKQTPDGALKVQVEEEVRDTVSDDFREAIMAATR